MLPQLKLALLFTKLAKEHGHKILHANNPDLLTRDLGDALKKQKDILSDPRKSAIITAYDVLPIIVEVKILTVLTANKLGVSTKGLSVIQTLDAITAAADARNGGKYAKDIKATLEWTRALFSHPEIRDVLEMEMTDIALPKNPKDLLKFIGQLAGRSQDELARVSEFLRKAKTVGEDLAPPPTPEKKPAPKRKPGK